ncbi:MAG: S9 family peptidase [Pseudomonadota bacterium]
MRVFGFLAFLLLFGGVTAHAEYPKPALDAYGALPQISSAEISPDGTKVAAIANIGNSTRAIIVEIGVGVKTQIGVEKAKARGIGFYDNDHIILRASETTSTFGVRNDYEYSGAFAINLETMDINQLLIRTRDLYPAQSGLGKIAGRGQKPGDVLMPAFTGGLGAEPDLDLMVAKLGSSRARRYMRGTSDTMDWFVGDGGRVLARERYKNRTNEYRVQWRTGDKWTDIYEAESDSPDLRLLGVAVDESGLIFIEDEGEGEVLMKLASDGTISGPIIPDRNRDIDRYYTDNGRKVLGVRYAGLVPDYAFLDPALQDSYDKMIAQLPNATIKMDSWSDDRSKVLYSVFDPALGDVWLVHSREDDGLSLIANSRPDIPIEAVGFMMSIEYKSTDDLTIQAIVTAPPDYDPATSGPMPTLVMPHGGPASYDRFDFNWRAQYFANRGYLVVQPNFRGSSGFGREFQRAGDGEWGNAMQDDITEGVKALAAAGMVDLDRVCIAGASYGGYAALAGAVFTPDLYQCVIAIAPVSDLNMMLNDEKQARGRDHWVVGYWEGLIADGDARRAKLRAISPANFAENVTAPVLLLHGNDDTVVPISQSTKMRRALRSAGKSVELVKLKGEDHWLSSAETRLQTLQEMDRFIATHLPLDE